MTSKPYTLVASSLLAMTAFLSQPSALAEPDSEPPGFHGMLVLGGDTIYASHLPMFTPQHRYQGIWRITFGADGDAVYRDARAQPELEGVIFTLAPEETFRLPELTGSRDSFVADVFVGHFERPGNKKLLEDVTVSIEEQIHWHPFLTEHTRPERLTYTMFSDGHETFAAHWISAVPDYDQIVTVKGVSPEIKLPPVAQMIVLDRGDDQALSAGEMVSVLLLEHRGRDTPIRATTTDLRVLEQVYIEERELSFSNLGNE